MLLRLVLLLNLNVTSDRPLSVCLSETPLSGLDSAPQVVLSVAKFATSMSCSHV